MSGSRLPLAESFATAMAALGVVATSRTAIAVSGGADSMALAALTRQWFDQVWLLLPLAGLVTASLCSSRRRHERRCCSVEESRGKPAGPWQSCVTRFRVGHRAGSRPRSAC